VRHACRRWIAAGTASGSTGNPPLGGLGAEDGEVWAQFNGLRWPSCGWRCAENSGGFAGVARGLCREVFAAGCWSVPGDFEIQRRMTRIGGPSWG